MQYKKTLASAALATTALAAYAPSEPWSTLTPSATFKSGLTDYASTFGIAVEPITTAVNSTTSTSKAKRDAVSQIGDGQIQATTRTTTTLSKKSTAAAVSQIGDGQIQATTATKKTAAAVSQIGDGQIQATTKTTAAAVSQIGDGQIQATTATKKTAAAVSQIGDGQIQATTKTTAAAVSQIGDGQIQATTATKKSTAAAASQIGDGQVQATTKATSTTTGAATTKTTQAATNPSDPVSAQSCKNDGTLSMTLKEGILVDGKGRIGSIVANRQFQFDGPPPQAGAIYAAGWSMTPEGNLAIGDNDVFYQCLSGNFYNLYDEHIGSQCTPVHLSAIDLVDC
ncbi:similar to Saccharomyces cerevisiae YKL164C PIR1 O- glycosylated protein required for cell wall stability [Maudiozyma barnettii]|uniref:Similar to Saccharomyces cerevisiae YKL164C PIR1 O- glycosylated protein required for cell wall stability n=1 Tax=Maudiozyma barnettii TaxID=61262 RepID=A0A8H2VIL7_9SACH|nr:uncharacterized protein KABA2_08S02398 [Kazachstania barnettii]CAB4256063.1 similar to Saccharomyces cerevisiae YKL164C PIR1 O- glycosylated protein required for cell wall stability [Kazachstania barnettii]CAD1784671.1 similar to Saccharomyces cerevisiae YKL164C PIR1 O- glycosylated protein required for cell wall stability [Kazachstania barnettii]